MALSFLTNSCIFTHHVGPFLTYTYSRKYGQILKVEVGDKGVTSQILAGPLSYLLLGFSRKESQTFLILLQNSAVAGQKTQILLHPTKQDILDQDIVF